MTYAKSHFVLTMATTNSVWCHSACVMLYRPSKPLWTTSLDHTYTSSLLPSLMIYWFIVRPFQSILITSQKLLQFFSKEASSSSSLNVPLPNNKCGAYCIPTGHRTCSHQSWGNSSVARPSINIGIAGLPCSFRFLSLFYQRLCFIHGSFDFPSSEGSIPVVARGLAGHQNSQKCHLQSSSSGVAELLPTIFCWNTRFWCGHGGCSHSTESPYRILQQAPLHQTFPFIHLFLRVSSDHGGSEEMASVSIGPPLHHFDRPLEP